MSDVLSDNFQNQGTALPLYVRDQVGLRGRIPGTVETLNQQCQRALTYMRTLSTSLEMYNYLQRIKYEDITLFYRMIIDNLPEIAPIIYTPTVGEACLKFSLIYTPSNRDGIFLSLQDIPYLDQILSSSSISKEIDIAVVTDGSRILGLGDIGINGMGIPQGKLALYVATAGFHPARTLPITLDLGTNNESHRNDPFYLGSRTTRPQDPEFFSFVDKVMAALYKRWPKMLVQFEDFSTNHAFDTLERYRNQYLMFNDDIQGTGAVILAGFINAVKQSQVPLIEHRIVFFGAGSAGVGVAQQLMEHIAFAGDVFSVEKARSQFWFVDSKGLITSNRGDKLQEHKVPWARVDNGSDQFKSLLDVIQFVKPTCLIGLATVGGSFDREVLLLMGQFNKRPIIMPLSNPLDNAECTFENAVTFTNGRVIFASGTAFPPTKHPSTGEIITPAQGNNMYIFPGVGLGSVVSGAKHVTENMINQAANTLANGLTPDEIAEGLLYPRLDRIREISAEIARDVAICAVKEGLARDLTVLSIVEQNPTDESAKAKLLAHIKDLMYNPIYPEAPKHSKM